MAVRRSRPPQPLAPHGLPGHLVEFVEALRGQGIAVGPSETVDAGKVLVTLGLGNREVLREGLACAVLRRPDHRDTYDAMFDLWWPAALGGRTVLIDEDEDADDNDAQALSADDVEAMRAMLLNLLNDNEDLANMDERLAAMIAQIVEQYGKYTSSRGPSYSSYQALKSMALDELEGKLLAGLLAPYGDDPTPTQEQIAKALAAQRINAVAQDGRGRDQAPHRRTAGPRTRADVRHPATGRKRRVPAGLRRAAAPDATRRRTAGPHSGHPAGRQAAPAPGRPDRSA